MATTQRKVTDDREIVGNVESAGDTLANGSRDDSTGMSMAAAGEFHGIIEALQVSKATGFANLHNFCGRIDNEDAVALAVALDDGRNAATKALRSVVGTRGLTALRLTLAVRMGKSAQIAKLL